AEGDVKVPLTAINSDFQKLLNDARKRYYKRTKKNTPFKRRVLEAATQRGINHKYVKFSREYTTENQVLNAAAERKRESNLKLTARKERSKVSSKAKRQAEKATKEVTQAQLRNEVRRRLVNEGLNDLAEADMIVPLKAKESNLDKLVNHARKRYYKRTKKHNKKQAELAQRLLNAGISDKKYIKFRKEHKTFENLLDAARKREAKNTKKSTKPLHKQAILDFAQQSLGLEPKQVRTLICAKEKK
ncbi:hypothetical protein EBU71_16925, partial [bacterium]|nr:hypothetical protein [Candidatus Elulimicrobium humile]